MTQKTLIPLVLPGLVHLLHLFSVVLLPRKLARVRTAPVPVIKVSPLIRGLKIRNGRAGLKAKY